MDPVTLLAAASAAFNGIKNAVAIGKEVEGVFQQLTKWADAAGQLQELINNNRGDQGQRKLGLFEKIGFKQSETSEAFDIFAAQMRLREMEEEIRLMFIYGELQHLGMEGYSQFNQIRREVREKRERMIRDQAKRRKNFIEAVFWYSLLVLVVTVGIKLAIWFYDTGAKAGKW
jgi:hypothetical protein